MSICVSAGAGLDPRGMYPVVDPRRTAGPGPHRYGYNLAKDGIVITVARTPGLSSCQMKVEFISTLHEPKEIQAFNFFLGGFISAVGSSAGLSNSMTIQKRTPGMSCSSGADTLVLARQSSGLLGRIAHYWFPQADLWDFWGGCTVTFDWQNDRAVGLWGDMTPEPSYPRVGLPDGTVMEATTATGSTFHVVFGGAAFTVSDPAYLMTLVNPSFVRDLSGTSAGVSTGSAISALDPSMTRLLDPVPFRALPTEPVDGTVIREWLDAAVYVCHGGAKFRIPDPSSLFALGFDWGRVRVIPPGGASSVRSMPRDGTLLREQSDPRVYLAVNGSLSWVTSPNAMTTRCLPWRHVRIVPDSSLAGLPKGPDLS